ncbi:ubiquitin carboxyl-terminal hydrolase 25 [Canna indica]|uniref:ubiquitinyl hydrolase 1 n=1 Tax=Canna indica TaxID=4628 RepID=A0AAQ3KZM5_9LILI|nr:ubiquitin carboxyl-terminal hydrolase 25 [Canna indica]
MALQMSWHPRCRRGGAAPLGLKNLGNSCYLNSVLQCLTYTPPLAQFCLSSRHSSLCKSVFANREKECPFCILERQISRSLSLDGTLDAPSKIHKCVALFAEHFRWGRQEDAHEFLRYVIDACHNACLKIHKRSGNIGGNGGVVGGDHRAEERPGPSTVMKDIFGGALLSQVKCLTCKGESNKTDEIMDICLDLYQTSSLKDALGRFFQPELLDGNNKYSCSNCKKLSVAKKQMFLQRAPNVLVIQLKRFEGINGGKINRNIEFNEILGLSKFMSNMNQDPEPEYSLFGSIVHSGFSPDSGHYYAYIKDASGRWYCCNDAHVSLSSTQEVLSEKVYILFYIRNNVAPKPSKSVSSCNGYKHSDTNGSNDSNLKSAEIAKPANIKSNGASGMLKNGKPFSVPQIKPINLKNHEIKRAISNGNGNLNVQSNGSIAKSVISLGETKMQKIEASTTSNLSEVDVKISADNVEKNNKETLILAAGNKYANPFYTNGSMEKDIEQAAVLGNGFDNAGSSKLKVDKHHTVNPELPKTTTSGNSVPREDSSSLGENGSHNNHLTSGKRHFREIEKFKELLVEEATSELCSCGWVEKVENFMRAKKRLCMQTAGSPPDKSSIRRHLITDAKKTFNSQIPESLKERLVERLKSFGQETPLLDS